MKPRNSNISQLFGNVGRVDCCVLWWGLGVGGSGCFYSLTENRGHFKLCAPITLVNFNKKKEKEEEEGTGVSPLKSSRHLCEIFPCLKNWCVRLSKLT